MRWVVDGDDLAKGRTKRSRAKGGRGAASRTLALLSAAFAYARPDDPNPCRGVVRPAKGKRERRLSDVEYRQLAEALDAAHEIEWPALSDLVRFVALTGWRVGEACLLRWEQVSIDARLATIDTKTGLSRRPLSKYAVTLLEARRASADASVHVFPTIGGGHAERLCSGRKGIWARLMGAHGASPIPLLTNARLLILFAIHSSASALNSALAYRPSAPSLDIPFLGMSVMSNTVGSPRAMCIWLTPSC
jgi:integrase